MLGSRPAEISTHRRARLRELGDGADARGLLPAGAARLLIRCLGPLLQPAREQRVQPLPQLLVRVPARGAATRCGQGRQLGPGTRDTDLSCCCVAPEAWRHARGTRRGRRVLTTCGAHAAQRARDGSRAAAALPEVRGRCVHPPAHQSMGPVKEPLHVPSVRFHTVPKVGRPLRVVLRRKVMVSPGCGRGWAATWAASVAPQRVSAR